MSNRRRRLGAAVVVLALVGVSACGRGEGVDREDDVAREGWAPPPEPEPDLADEVAQLRAQAVTFDAATEVGALPGRSGVTPSGQAVYSIPLDVAPGVGAMTPALSLEYRSSTQNGPLGVGFSLGGIAASVRRCDRTIGLDGRNERFAFELDDPLCWGGDRLVLVAGDYGQDGAEYRTRHDPFAKIVQHGDGLSRGCTFEVFTKDGRILSFGQPDAALVRTIDGTTIPWMWALRSAEDRFGNAIEYRYDAPVEAGEVDPYALQLREIAYGGTGSEASRRHVRFEYQGRTDASWGYVAGVRQGRVQRLESIVAEGPQGEVVATYAIGYQQDPASGHSRIEWVRKCDAAGDCLPDTVFEWSDPGGLLELQQVPYHLYMPSAELSGEALPFVTAPVRLVGDFDGNGDHDLLFFAEDRWRAWDGSAQDDLMQTPVNVASPVVLPEGDAYVEAAIGGLDAAAPLHLDRLQPAFSISVTDANGDLRDDLVIPQRPQGGADQVDAWGYRFAQDVRVAVAATPEGEAADAGFTEPIAFTDGLARLDQAPIYSVTPLDHDGDGLGDLWLCQGEGYKSGHWVLARREPDPAGPSGVFTYVRYDSGVGCSVHDELLVTSLHGGRQDLLVIPAYATDPGMPVPSDFPDAQAYHDDYHPVPEGQRLEYQALSFEPGEGPGVLEPTGLPRDHYQRWHDRLCRNGLARAYYGRPLASAGLGLDKLADVNGDGLVDIVRFELQSGDHPGNPEIVLGLDGIALWDEDLLCSADVEANIPARLRAYLSTGDGFVPGPVLHTFSGNPHANLWLNFQRAQLYDFDLDGVVDFLLPGSGPGTGFTMLLSVGDGTYTDHPVALPSGWPAYTDDATWREDFDEALLLQVMTLQPTIHDRAQITFLGVVQDNPAGWPFLLNTLATTYDEPHNRVTRITDGLGAVTELGYRHIAAAGQHGIAGMHTYPRTGARAPMAVVERHAVQSSPQGDFETDFYAYDDAVVDAWGQGFLGFAEVERWSGNDPGAHAWIRFEYDRDATLADYPTAGRPTEMLEERRTQREDGSYEHWLTRTRQTYETVVQEELGGSTMFTYPSRQDVEVFVREVSCASDCEPGPSERFQGLVVEQVRDELGTVVSTITTNAAETRTYEVRSMLDDTAAWIVGKPLFWVEGSCVHDECGQRMHEATYDPATGAVLTSTFAPDDPVARLHTEYEHDVHGNVRMTRSTNQEGDARTTTTTWDAEGVHPESMTNAVGHTSWVVHHPATGVPVAEVAADGVTWVHRYDGLLRPTRHERRATPLGLPDGHVTTIDYELGGSVHDDTHPADSALRVRTTAPDGQEVTEDYAATQQLMQRAWWGMQALEEVPYTVVEHGDEVYTSTLYDHRGRVQQSSLPTWAPAQPEGYTTTAYDGLSRVVAVEHPHGTTERWSYGLLSRGLETLHTDERGVETRTQTDDAARVAVTIDAHGTPTCFTHGPFGVLQEVRRDCADPSTPWVSTFDHDVAGRITFESDPSFGKRSYHYDGFGQLREVETADEATVSFDYDGLGRLLSRHDADGDTEHHYDVGRPGYLAWSESPDGVVLDYGYDASGRMSSVVLADMLLTVPGALQLQYEHGVGDRLEGLRYPAVDGEPEVHVRYRYDAVGYLRRVEHAAGSLLWSALAADEGGRLLHERFGNGLDTLRSYEPLTGRPSTIDTVGGATDAVQSLAYAWHPYGELQSRTDAVHGHEESFEHDALGRLTNATVTRGEKTGVVDVAYDTVGNILAKTGVGSYAYDGGRLAAYGTGIPVLLGHDDRGNVISHGQQSLTYTPFDELRQLTEGGETLDFRYDADGDRFSRTKQSTGELIVDVRGLYERRTEGGQLELTYRVPAAGRIVAQILRTPGPAGTWNDETQWLHDDHLGSTHVVTDEAGAVVRTIAYDPWGQARAGNDWLVTLGADALEDLGLGFTGHPARLDADLVDMGGRSYHPRLGRFFSPDPFVVAPLDGQAYNRYAYVRNGPLTATDPTGYGEEDFDGADEVPTSNPEGLPYHCDGSDCYRTVVVGGDAGSSLDAWNDALYFFDLTNGPGQRGPGFNGGNPYSPNGHRHGNDGGQPGGTPVFTIAVTEDMCAQISACSGGLPHRRPSVIWDAPIDEWAETAADIASDFVPGVSHAKTAYDAYERLQNGEDPLDVLTSAAGDAALGLVPGLKGAKKLGKTLDKVDDAADAAGDVQRNARARFVGQPDGQVVDTHATPAGSYDQPGLPVENGTARARTDILQGADHGAGLSHTHDPKLHRTPDGRTFLQGHEQPGRPVSFEDVQNIQSGAASRSKPKHR